MVALLQPLEYSGGTFCFVWEQTERKRWWAVWLWELRDFVHLAQHFALRHSTNNICRFNCLFVDSILNGKPTTPKTCRDYVCCHECLCALRPRSWKMLALSHHITSSLNVMLQVSFIHTRFSPKLSQPLVSYSQDIVFLTSPSRHCSICWWHI